MAQVEHGADGCPPWQVGSEIVVGATTYALEAVGLAEVVAPDASHVRRQAMARQTSPPPRRGNSYAWLRQVRRRRPSEAAKAARAALLQERRLLPSGRVAPSRCRSIASLRSVGSVAGPGS